MNIKFIWAFGLAIIISVAVIFGSSKLFRSKNFSQAQEYLKDGYTTLAWDLLERDKYDYVDSVEKCEVLINAAIGTFHPQNVAWASEACAAKKFESKDIIIGLSVAAKLKGNLQGAIGVLQQNLQKYDAIPDLHYLMAKHLIQLGNKAGAANSYLAAYQRSNNNLNVGLEIVNYLASSEFWEAASNLAKTLVSADIKNVEAKLLLARVLHKTNNQNEFNAVKGSIQQMAGQMTQQNAQMVLNAVAQIEKEEVLKPAAPPKK